MKWLLKIFDEEPGNIGCAGVILAMILIVISNKCFSDSVEHNTQVIEYKVEAVNNGQK
jgi:hypothetical protein